MVRNFLAAYLYEKTDIIQVIWIASVNSYPTRIKNELCELTLFFTNTHIIETHTRIRMVGSGATAIMPGDEQT